MRGRLGAQHVMSNSEVFFPYPPNGTEHPNAYAVAAVRRQRVRAERRVQVVERQRAPVVGHVSGDLEAALGQVFDRKPFAKQMLTISNR